MTSNNISVYMGKGGMKKVNVRRVRALARVDCPRQNIKNRRKTINDYKVQKRWKRKTFDLKIAILAATRQSLHEDI